MGDAIAFSFREQRVNARRDWTARGSIGYHLSDATSSIIRSRISGNNSSRRILMIMMLLREERDDLEIYLENPRMAKPNYPACPHTGELAKDTVGNSGRESCASLSS
jgi:hypothetical protein